MEREVRNLRTEVSNQRQDETTKEARMRKGKRHVLILLLASSFWNVMLTLVVTSCIVSLILVPFFPVLGLLGCALIWSTLLVPLETPCPRLLRRFMEFTIHCFEEYLSTEVVYEKPLVGKGPYIIAYEPHDVLPLGMCVFSHIPPQPLPPALQGCCVMVSDACFWVPIMRNLWWWIGCRPVTKECILDILRSGTSVAICPGGVQECLYMEPGMDVVYLKNRLGFIRLAMTCGVDILPVYGFGQCDLYSYWRPLYDGPRLPWISKKTWSQITRKIRFVPMVAWGLMGTPLPRQAKLRIVVGEPIPVTQIDVPDNEIASEYLDSFKTALKGIYDRYVHEHREYRRDSSANPKKQASLLIY